MAGKAVYRKMATKFGADSAKSYLYGDGNHPLEEKYGKLNGDLKYGDLIEVKSAKDFKAKLKEGQLINFKGNDKTDKAIGKIDSFRVNGIVVNAGSLGKGVDGKDRPYLKVIRFKDIGSTPLVVREGNKVNVIDNQYGNK